MVFMSYLFSSFFFRFFFFLKLWAFFKLLVGGWSSWLRMMLPLEKEAALLSQMASSAAVWLLVIHDGPP